MISRPLLESGLAARAEARGCREGVNADGQEEDGEEAGKEEVAVNPRRSALSTHAAGPTRLGPRPPHLTDHVPKQRGIGRARPVISCRACRAPAEGWLDERPRELRPALAHLSPLGLHAAER